MISPKANRTVGAGEFRTIRKPGPPQLPATRCSPRRTDMIGMPGMPGPKSSDRVTDVINHQTKREMRKKAYRLRMSPVQEKFNGAERCVIPRIFSASARTAGT